jgi:hypothetical protein
MAAPPTEIDFNPMVKESIARNAGRLKTPMIVALARKLLVVLRKYVNPAS